MFNFTIFDGFKRGSLGIKRGFQLTIQQFKKFSRKFSYKQGKRRNKYQEKKFKTDGPKTAKRGPI